MKVEGVKKIWHGIEIADISGCEPTGPTSYCGCGAICWGCGADPFH